MNLPRFSVRHPVTVIMGIMVVLTMGFMALWELPLDMFPDITYPVLSIVTRYPGAAPEEVETLVTKPLEEALATVHGVTDVTSVSQYALSMVNLEFEWGANLDEAANDARDTLQYARRFLPSEIDPSVIVKIDLSKMPIYVGTLRGNRSLPSLQRLAEKIIKPRLARIDGVAALGFLSEEEEEVQIEADIKALEKYQVGFNRLLSMLGGINRNYPAGSLLMGGKETPLRTMGESEDLAFLKNLPLLSGPGGGHVTLSQVASVRRGIRSQDVSIARNGESCLALQIMKQSGKNSVRILQKVQVELEKIRGLLPGDVNLEKVFDQSEFIVQAIDSVKSNLVLGGILTLGVLFFFLKKFALVGIIGLAIPLSVIATFIPIYFLRYSLNMMSLGGLALGVGMLVDNAIVVLENIDRHLETGKRPEDAAAEASNEVAGAITGSTLTTVAVFVPFLFSEGIAARLFIQLGVTITVSLVASLFLAITLVPMMAAFLVRKPTSVYGPMRHERFRAFVSTCLDHPKTVILASILAFFGTVFFVGPRLGWEYIPFADDGMVSSPFRLPIGLSKEESREILRPLIGNIASDPRVFSVFQRIGMPEGAEEIGAAIGLADTNEGEMFIRLVPKNQRSITTRQYLEEIRKQTRTIPGLEINLRQSFEQLFNTEAKSIAIHVQGAHLPVIKGIMSEVVEALRKIEGIRDLDVDLKGGKPELQLQVDREKAIQAGLTVPSIGESVRTALQGRKIGIYRHQGDEFYIRLMAPRSLKGDPEKILDIPFETVREISGAQPGNFVDPTPGNRMTSLRNLVKLVPGTGEEKLKRRKQIRRGTVSANYTARSLGDVMAEVTKALGKIQLPEGYFLEIGGTYDDLLSSIRQLTYVFLLGGLLVYMIMASQFESLFDPFCILFTLPLAVTGMLLILWATSQTLNVSSALGLVILLGIVVNNAIVLIDFVKQRREHGIGLREALIESTQVRLRPILMTTITTALGLVPLSLALGEGSEIQQPMAISIIGGLSLSTLLTLFVIPCYYLVFNRWLGRK